MGQARLQRHESDFLEDKVVEGRVLERYEQTGVRTWNRWGKISLNVSIISMEARWTGMEMAEAVYTTASLHEWY
jgi:hypothetical protein